ncbi:soluble quino protein glucose/sorbosone dehydrogenase [Podospora aff. communis PSN243]|uniref:Soluble quino protein glucose/sorbosone dehydrogenase n=1 Tax=Podospora aff. communis PSN243 TaxID=3040156 RepID=A0AAV9G910_9PEZI|nr:soluble quino protein glucose/sorbosone dehydrogenase [Podospora aff. communis PSN243]
MDMVRAAIAAALLHAAGTSAQAACSVNLRSQYPAPQTAEGYQARLIVSGLSRPRGIIFDKSGNLLVVETRSGAIKQINFASDDKATCLAAGQTRTLVSMPELNHGIQISPDGKTLYASSADKVYRWDYDAASGRLTNQRTIIENMMNADHVTRTLYLSKKHPELLLVSRGSADNIDPLSADIDTGISQIRAFNLSTLGSTPFDHPTSGTIIGWGLRNSVGIDEHPVTSGLYSVENSADQVHRGSADIHEENPGEELNFHGILPPPPNTRPPNHGYPYCLALWDTEGVPNLGDLKTGSQFTYNNPLPPSNITDETCNSDFVAPRLTFQSHMAPLDIKFDSTGARAYISFHGSWNRDSPAGYKVSTVAFNRERGEPVDPPDSRTAVVDVLVNADLSRCPQNCFRPAGLAVDDENRVFMTSDTTGEIYVVARTARDENEGGGGGGGDGDGDGLGNGAAGKGASWGLMVGTLVMGAWGMWPL